MYVASNGVVVMVNFEVLGQNSPLSLFVVCSVSLTSPLVSVDNNGPLAVPLRPTPL